VTNASVAYAEFYPSNTPRDLGGRWDSALLERNGGTNYGAFNSSSQLSIQSAIDNQSVLLKGVRRQKFQLTFAMAAGGAVDVLFDARDLETADGVRINRSSPGSAPYGLYFDQGVGACSTAAFRCSTATAGTTAVMPHTRTCPAEATGSPSATTPPHLLQQRGAGYVQQYHGRGIAWGSAVR